MIEIVVSIVVALLEPLLKHNFEKDNHSVCERLQMMHSQLTGIIYVCEKNLGLIEYMIIRGYDTGISSAIKQNLLKIFTLTNEFVSFVDDIEGAIEIFDPETGKRFRFMHVYDLNLFSTLDHIIGQLQSKLELEDEIFDYDPLAHTPLDENLLRFFGYPRKYVEDMKLEKARNQTYFRQYSITSIDDLIILCQGAEHYLLQLKSEANSLAVFVRKQCTINELSGSSDFDVEVVIPEAAARHRFLSLNERINEMTQTEVMTPWYFVQPNTNPIQLNNPQMAYEFAVKSQKAGSDELAFIKGLISV